MIQISIWGVIFIVLLIFFYGIIAGLVIAAWYGTVLRKYGDTE